MNGFLPDWAAAWLNLTPSTDTQTIRWQLQSEWPWAPWVSVLIIALSAAWVAFCYSRENPNLGKGYRIFLAVLRMSAIATMMLMLARFSLVLKRTAPPTIAVIVDRSASMGLFDSYPALSEDSPDWLNELINSSPTRLSLAKQLTTSEESQLLELLANEYQVRLYFADGEVVQSAPSLPEQLTATTELSLEGTTSQQSMLGNAIQQVLTNLSGTPPAALLMFSDGANTGGQTLQQAAQLSRRKGVPLFMIGLGSDLPPVDLELANLLVDDVVFADDLISFEATVRSQGISNKQTRVVLRQTGNLQILDEALVELSPGTSTQTVRLTYRAVGTGSMTFELEIEPTEGEVDLENNRLQRTISVRDEQIRVLLAQSTPSYEYRYLKTLLERDPTVELSTYLQEADLRHVSQDASALRSFPLGEKALDGFDVLILGDINPRLLPRSVWPDIQRFVEEQGGGVVFVAGPRYLPWDYRDIPAMKLMMPIDIQAVRRPGLDTGQTAPFTPQPSQIGKRMAPLQLADSIAESEQIWKSLPPSYWLAEASAPKPGAQVLLEHPFRTGDTGQRLPITCLQYFGSGRVLFQAIDSTWRWRIRVGDVFFARYWVQLVRFMARSSLLQHEGAELTTDRKEYQIGETVDFRLRLSKALSSNGTPAQVLVESPNQTRQQLSLTRDPLSPKMYIGQMADLHSGSYRAILMAPNVADEPPAARFSVVAPLGELAQPQMRLAEMTAASETTFGKFYSINSTPNLVHQLMADLPTGRRLPLEVLPAIPLWNHPVLLVILLCLLTTEWVLRRRLGLL